jgi:hypothetical protein
MAALPLASEVYVSLMDVDVPVELRTLLSGTPAAEPEPAPLPADAIIDAGALPVEPLVAAMESPEPAPESRELLTTFPPARMPARARAPDAPAAEEDFFRPVDSGDFDRYARVEPKSRSLSHKLAPWMESVRAAPFWAIAGVATVIAVYLAMAVGNSIQGGGGDAGAVPLQSASSAGSGTTGEVIECGSPFVALEHGTESVVSFERSALDGFEIGGLAVTPNSSAATPQGLKAAAEGTHSIKFQAAKVQSTTNRTDEYLLRISWRKGSEPATSECPVTVRVSAAAP